MKRLIFFIWTFGLAVNAGAQTAGKIGPPNEPAIFHYIHNSEYVVIATLEKTEPVALVNKKEKEPNTLNLEDSVAGMLHTFKVEKVLRSKEIEGAFQRGVIQDFEVFVPMAERHEEFYSPGQKYLIFLRLLPNQKEIFAKFELNPAKTYFNAFESQNTLFANEWVPFHGAPKKGIIKIPDEKRHSLIERIETLCSAFSEEDKVAKIRKLRKLARSDDKELKANAQYAIKILQD